jgi:hypothetical protein
MQLLSRRRLHNEQPAAAGAELEQEWGSLEEALLGTGFHDTVAQLTASASSAW